MSIFERISTLFLSILILLGVFGADVSVKKQIPIGELEFSGVDIPTGHSVSIPVRSGTLRFNRISFDYDASAPFRVFFTYRQGLKTKEEELLLSEKDHSASMFLDCYLDRKTASRLMSVRFEPVVSGGGCTLSISGFTCDLQTAPKDDVLYLENDRFKIGIILNWGGGLCCFIDKRNDKYGNLLNFHDTGRLVQQSYYGPTDIEGYDNGVFLGNRWGYNPVQGGDQYGNTSKLVALEKTDDRIRVVCRPLDWAQNDMLTQTYYTNVYTLTETGLTVENTAVDFLQTPWTDRDQEIPAFYTISALGTFMFYDGEEPWTDAPLRAERDLEFWGEKPFYYDLSENNDETWCAWADNDGYAIGLFTPIATRFLAGRFMYDGTSDPDANPTNYVAPLGVFHLNYDEPFTYTYYLTSGTVDEVRETFKTVR